jgi:hypothetical protein
MENYSKERWDEDILKKMRLLVAFLNFGFDDRSKIWEELRAYHFGLYGWIDLEFRWRPGFLSWKVGALRKVLDLKAEIERDLKPFLDSHSSGRFGCNEKFELEMLIERINHILKPKWYVDKFSKEIASRKVTPYAGILDFDGSLYQVTHTSLTRNFRQFLYLIIILSLESGQFTRIRRCKNCSKFLVAEHGNQETCDEQCSRAYFRLDAPSRKQKSNAKKQREIEEKGVPILTKIAHSDLQSIRQMFGEKFDDFLPYAERIKKEEDPARVWFTLPRRFKQKLANATGHK